MWDPHALLAQHLAFFSLHNPGDRVGCTRIVRYIARLLFNTTLLYCMHACVFSLNRSMDGLLTKALIREGSEEARPFVSKILQYVAAMGNMAIFFYLVAFVTDQVVC